MIYLTWLLCRLAVACLEETMAHFIAALLTYSKSITDAFLKQIERDYAQICEFFEKYCIKEKVPWHFFQSSISSKVMLDVRYCKVQRNGCVIC